jgi:predicted RNase H-like HicB family nuclease
MKIKAIVHVAQECGFWAAVPTLPGCVTEGDSID